MKKIINIFMALLVFSLLSGTVFSLASPTTASAAGACDKSFLGFPTWYRNISTPTGAGGQCEIKGPTELVPEMSVPVYVLQIGLNIVDMLIVAVGYLCAGFILFGGFNFVLSSGDSDKMAKARTTLLNASIGLVLCIASVVIVRFITSRLGIS